MATVADLSGNSPAGWQMGSFGGVDPAFAGYNRTVTSSPVGVTTPLYVGEKVLDTGSNAVWYAVTATSAGWVPAQLAG